MGSKIYAGQQQQIQQRYQALLSGGHAGLVRYLTAPQPRSLVHDELVDTSIVVVVAVVAVVWAVVASVLFLPLQSRPTRCCPYRSYIPLQMQLKLPEP